MHAPNRAGLAMLLGLALAPMQAPGSSAQDRAPTETLLRLAESAEIEVAPDQIDASLRIDATAETAPAAQAAANRRAQAAFERIRKVPGIEVETGAYWTSRDQDRGRWRAVQVLDLRGREGPPMLELVGALQSDGLTLQRLAWTLSRETQRKAREQATTRALEGLRGRAEAIAATLGLGFVGFREVRVDAPRSSPPAMMRAAPMAASAAPPPVAEPGVETVGATVEADALLRPR